ncbi:MAG: hypothetical protein C6P37_08265 [Caldibacillus debilis]|uniref:Uncharacterized protein n=1 Tax=Caldibacillus debilis TaxID=301148 RepID=A0A3E0K5L8_9BACI|nr:MAG: hypothetical protein C6P37_08265 [Caldibacillus debilis]
MPSSEYTVCHDFTIFSEDFPGPDEGFSAIIPRLFAAMRSRIFRFSPKKEAISGSAPRFFKDILNHQHKPEIVFKMPRHPSAR